MFSVDGDGTISVTRGDVAVLRVGAVGGDGLPHEFKGGDVLRLQVFERNRPESVLVSKSVAVGEASAEVEFQLTPDDTSVVELASRPRELWYEVELNPDTAPQTIVGYDEAGPKVFRIYPEGGPDGVRV